MPLDRGLLISLPFVLCFSLSLAATCYSVQGEPLSEIYVPCNPTAQYSACCNTGDLCTSNGLCLATTGDFQGFLYGDGCTDSTGRADECPHACGDVPSGWNTYSVLQCNPGTWCCRSVTDSRNCCDNTSVLIDTTAMSGSVLPLQAEPTSTSSSPSSSSSSYSSSPSSSYSSSLAGTPLSTCSQTPIQQYPKCNSTVIGGAVGGALGAAFLAALFALIVLGTRQRSSKRGNDTLLVNGGHIRSTSDANKFSLAPMELDGSQRQFELAGARQ